MVRSLVLVFLFNSIDAATYNDFTSDKGEFCKKPESGETLWITKILTSKMISFLPSGVGKADSLCTHHGVIYENHLKNLTFWATKMFDARGTGVNSGLLYGNNFNMGNFEECVSISVPELGINGKYVVAMLEFFPEDKVYPNFVEDNYTVYREPPCTASTWEALKPTKDRRMKKRNIIKWAICVPDSCSEEDTEISLRNHIYPSLNFHNIRGNISILQKYTYSRHETVSKQTAGYFVFLYIVKGLFVLVALSTIIDLRSDNNPNKPWYMHFSMKAHLPQLFSTKQSEFPAISGMKVLSMFLIIFGHRVMFTMDSSLYNSKETELWVGDFGSIFVLNGIIIVNTFMTLTGFLTFYKLMKDIERGKEIALWSRIVQRWFRLFPTYGFVIAVQHYLLPMHEGGPLSRNVLWDLTTCGKYWWTHFLFLNNYISNSNQCLIPSWYMAVDFQMYIVVVLLGYLYMKRPRVGIYVIAAVTFISCIIPGIYVMVYRYYGISLMYSRSFNEHYLDKEFSVMYMYTHLRAAPSLIGVVGVFVYLHLKKAKVTTSQKQNWSLASLSIVLSLSALLLPYFFYSPGRPYVLWENIVYAVYHRIAWCTLIITVIVFGALSDFGPLEYTVKAPVLEPFNKLTYCALIIHTPLQLYLSGFIRTPAYYSSVLAAWMCFADICITYIFSVILYCLVESPFAALYERYVNNKSKKQFVKDTKNNIHMK